MSDRKNHRRSDRRTRRRLRLTERPLTAARKELRGPLRIALAATYGRADGGVAMFAALSLLASLHPDRLDAINGR